MNNPLPPCELCGDRPQGITGDFELGPRKAKFVVISKPGETEEHHHYCETHVSQGMLKQAGQFPLRVQTLATPPQEVVENDTMADCGESCCCGSECTVDIGGQELQSVLDSIQIDGFGCTGGPSFEMKDMPMGQLLGLGPVGTVLDGKATITASGLNGSFSAPKTPEQIRQQREEQYGGGEENPSEINCASLGMIWRGLIFCRTRKDPGELPADLVALMLSGQKVGRSAYPKFHKDSFDDAHVYLKIGEELARGKATQS